MTAVVGCRAQEGKLDDSAKRVENFLDVYAVALGDGREGEVGLAGFGYVDDPVGKNPISGKAGKNTKRRNPDRIRRQLAGSGGIHTDLVSFYVYLGFLAVEWGVRR